MNWRRRAPTTAAIPDERLGLMFVCAHRAIEPGVRAPLMFRTVLGLDTAAIASAFLVAPATMGQRLVRARSRIRLAGIPFQVPEAAELPDRLDDVLDAIYAAFAAGWSDPAGTEVRRRDLASEAIWLGRLVASLLPEARGSARFARPDALRRGPPVRAPWAARGTTCRSPSRTRPPWDQPMIAEAEAVLRRAGTLGVVGRFQLEAAIQSAHVVRRVTGNGGLGRRSSGSTRRWKR